MNNWKHRLDVSDVFHDDTLTLAEKTKPIVRRIKSARGFKQADDDSWGGLSSVLEELADAAEEGDTGWWDAVWDAVYDFMDEERVWVITHKAVQI
jgi:hypothetical protein